MASFSWAMVVSVWVTTLRSCETVTSPLTSGARRVMLVDSGRSVPDSVSASRAGRFCVATQRVFLRCASCCAMTDGGCSIEGMPDRDGRG